jgi:transposase
VGLLLREVPASCLVVAVDPGKAFNRVWLATGDGGLIGEPVSLPVLRDGVDALERLVAGSGVPGDPVVGLEATGGLHRAWAAEIERRWPGSLRLFAPSETAERGRSLGRGGLRPMIATALRWCGWSARARDAALVMGLLRRCSARSATAASSSTRAGCSSSASMTSSTRFARASPRLLVMAARSSSRRRLGRPSSRARPLSRAGRRPSGRCWRGRPARMTEATAGFWADRWKRLLDPPPDGELRARRLGRDLGRWQDLQVDIATAEDELAGLLAQTDGQVLTTLPGVAVVRAAEFAAYTLPIERWPTPERLYSATGLAPATYQSSTVTRRGRISRQGLAEHRNALMGIAWGLSQNSDAFKERDRELRARGFRPIQARVALARHACRLCWRLLQTQHPYDERRYAHARQRGR